MGEPSRRLSRYLRIVASVSGDELPFGRQPQTFGDCSSFLDWKGRDLRKLGVIALSAPHWGGIYQYSQSMLEGLRHAQGYEITLYADPSDRDLARLGYPIRGYA